MTEHSDDIEAFAYRVKKGCDGQVILDEELAERILAMASGNFDLLTALKTLLDSIEINDDRAVSLALSALAKAEGLGQRADATSNPSPAQAAPAHRRPSP